MSFKTLRSQLQVATVAELETFAVDRGLKIPRLMTASGKEAFRGRLEDAITRYDRRANRGENSTGAKDDEGSEDDEEDVDLGNESDTYEDETTTPDVAVDVDPLGAEVEEESVADTQAQTEEKAVVEEKQNKTRGRKRAKAKKSPRRQSARTANTKAVDRLTKELEAANTRMEDMQQDFDDQWAEKQLLDQIRERAIKERMSKLEQFMMEAMHARENVEEHGKNTQKQTMDDTQNIQLSQESTQKEQKQNMIKASRIWNRYKRKNSTKSKTHHRMSSSATKDTIAVWI